MLSYSVQPMPSAAGLALKEYTLRGARGVSSYARGSVRHFAGVLKLRRSLLDPSGEKVQPAIGSGKKTPAI